LNHIFTCFDTEPYAKPVHFYLPNLAADRSCGDVQQTG
jgi:hypothetical protein